MAYAKWAGKRLPTEAEWEFAARGRLAGKPFAWRDEFRPHGECMANAHQGHFPDKDSGSDGYVGIAPVAQFPPNPYGLYDMAGNVWQWTSDWYSPHYYQQLVAASGVAATHREFREIGDVIGRSELWILIFYAKRERPQADVVKVRSEPLDELVPSR